MPEEQAKKQEVKQEPVKEELTDEELSGLSGGGKGTERRCDSGESPGSPALG